MTRFLFLLILLFFYLESRAQNPKIPALYLRNKQEGFVKTFPVNRRYTFKLKENTKKQRKLLINQHGDSLVFKGNLKICYTDIDSIEWVNAQNTYRIVIGSLFIGSNLILYYFQKNPAGIIWSVISLPIAFSVLNKVERVWLTNSEWKLDNQNKLGLPVSN
ncbi:MAG: hypothetical protein FGM41_10050 [Bacteroidetes bacterium]|nr:hypothetical protein [Bacteroidota bacterium]